MPQETPGKNRIIKLSRQSEEIKISTFSASTFILLPDPAIFPDGQVKRAGN
jgi:hypothetical protein